MRKIGLLGGTFDPPHIGHFIIAQEVKNVLNLDKVWFIPTYEPPHKTDVFFTGSERREMLEAATEASDSYAVEAVELHRKGKSYTIDTVKKLRESYPSDEFYFIIGADMVEYLPKWHRIDELFSLIEFVGVERKNYSLSTPYPVQFIDVPLIDISSTYIRDRMKEGQDVQYFLPHGAYIYLKEHFWNESSKSR